MHRRPLLFAVIVISALWSAGPASAVRPTAPTKNFYFGSWSDTTAPEGDSNHAAIAVLRTYTKGPATVDLVIAENGSATSPGDFDAQTITLYFPNGADAALVQWVPAKSDGVTEGDETFVAYLANPTKGYTKSSDWTITIPGNVT